MTAFLHGLWMTGDLLLYGAFASFFAVCLGGQLPQWILLLPAVCYGVSFCFSRRPILRGCFGAACLLGLLFLPGWVDRAAYLPAAFYAFYLAARGEYHLSASRQAGVFVLFCKVYPVFALALSLLWDGEVMLTVSLPLAIWAGFLQIFLMRVLRQTSAVYQNPGFLLRNVGSLAALGAAGFLLSCPVVLGTAQAAVGAVYFGLAVPILEKPLAGIAWLAEHALMPALTGLLNWIAAQSGERGLDVAAGDSGSPAAGQVILSAEDPLLDGERILEIVGILLLAVGCILLFRHLFQKNKETQTEAGPAKTQWTSRRIKRRWPSFFLHPNARVRRAYSRYLERQAEHGAARGPAETSLDRLGRTPFLDPDAEQQLRRLYLKARYGECATPQDAAAAERLEKALETQK